MRRPLGLLFLILSLLWQAAALERKHGGIVRGASDLEVSPACGRT